MITLISDEEAATLSEDEIAARYEEFGLDRQYAGYVAAVLRGELTSFPTD